MTTLIKNFQKSDRASINTQQKSDRLYSRTQIGQLDKIKIYSDIQTSMIFNYCNNIPLIFH